MKRLQYIPTLLLLLLALLAGCTENELFQDDEQVVLRYNVSLPQDAQTRAAGDGSAVDQLIVGVFEDGATTGVNFTFPVEDGKASPAIPLFRTKTYNLVFWAQTENNGVYNTKNLSNITIDYSNYPTDLQEVEKLDAFSATKKEVTATTASGSITLTRPFALLNIGAAGTTLEDVNKVTLTVDKLYTSYQPLTETLIGEDVTEGHTFTFTDLEHSKSNSFTNEDDSGNETTYTNVASAFVLVPVGYTPTISAKLISVDKDSKDETVVKEIPETKISASNLTTNYATNIGVPLTEGWSGGDITIEKIEPSSEDGIIQIDTAEKLAFLMKYGYAGTSADNPQVIHLCKDFDMKVAVERDASYKLENITFDGGNFTIYNLPTALFSSATNIEVKDLTLSESAITNGTGHIGALVNELKGNASFSNVTVTGAAITTSNGAAGGIVGYISRINETTRTEKLEVTFSACKVENTTITGTQAEGKLVGLLSGYDNQEKLTFKKQCQATSVTITDYTSPYTEGYESIWLSNTDYKDYSGFLGDEKYCRGTVMYGENQFIPCWMGRTDVVPLDANQTLDGVAIGKVVYSATDMAYFSGKSYSAGNVYLRTDIDMGGKIGDGQPFTPIVSMTHLDGLKKGISTFSSFDNCYTIYNLKAVYTHKNANGAAFINVASNDTHQNLVFDGAYIDSKHDATITDIDDSDYGNAYAGTLVSRVAGTYKATNILIKNGTVSGVCKMGGLLGACWGDLQATNCNVDSCTIQNHDPKCINWYYQKETIGSLVAYAKDSFYTDGECGGLIGFISGCSPTITNCSVTNTTMNCTGEADKAVKIGVYSASGFDENNLGNPLASGKVTIAGRHVNQFIGDIRTTATGNTIKIVNPYVNNNSYIEDKNEHLFTDTETKTKTNQWTTGNWYNKKYYRTYNCVNDKQYSTIVGCAYVVAVTLNIDALNINKHVGDYKGTISINNSKISSNSSTSTGVTTGEETEWNGALPETWQCTYNWTYQTTHDPQGESTFTRYVGDDFSL